MRFFIIFIFIYSTTLLANDVLEPLYGVTYSKNKLLVQVMSNGCTQAKDFRISSENGKLSIYRIKPDRCRRMPFLVELVFDFPGSHPVTLENPVMIKANKTEPKKERR